VSSRFFEFKLNPRLFENRLGRCFFGPRPRPADIFIYLFLAVSFISACFGYRLNTLAMRDGKFKPKQN